MLTHLTDYGELKTSKYFVEYTIPEVVVVAIGEEVVGFVGSKRY